MSKVKRLFGAAKTSTTITTWYSRIPLVINVFFVLPLVLRYFSITDVAFYYLVGSFVRYQDIADLGFGFSYTRYYSYAYAGTKSLLTRDITSSNQKDGSPQLGLISGLYKSNRKHYLVISIVFVLLLGGYATYQMRAYLSDQFFLITWLSFVLSLAVKVRYKFVESFIVGVQELARLRLITGHFAVAQVIVLFVVLLVTKSILAGIWVNIVFIWVIVLRNYVLSRKIFKEKGIDLSESATIEKTVEKELVSIALKSGLGNLVTSGFYTTSGFIFTPILSELNLAILLFANKIIDIIRDFSRAPFYSKLPELNTIYIHNRAALKEKSRRYINRSIVIYLMGSVGFLLTNKVLLQLIGGDLKEIPNLYWIAISVVFFLERIGSISVQLYSVSNKVKYHIFNTIYLVVSLVVLIVTVDQGLYSYPLALTVGLVLVYLPASLVLLAKEYGWNLLSLYKPSIIVFLIFISLSICYDFFL